jgi:hypothetical protein
VARFVSAAMVEAKFAAELVVELEALPVVAADTELAAEAALDAFRRLDRAEAWLLLTLPIDIVTPVNTAGSNAIG